MGNFSRNPDDRIKDSISKHYVSVRLQQGVPLLDADINELDGLRKVAGETIAASWIGDGVPEGSDGFRIYALADDNSFGIHRGDLLCGGRQIVCDTDTTYTGQSNEKLAQKLTTPAGDTAYIVYVDTWEREVDGLEDATLVDPKIGIKTCVRLKREWVVLTVAGSTPAALPQPLTGHALYPLALIRRKGGSAKITAEMISDLRRLHLTLASTTKQPLELYDGSGTLTYDTLQFSAMLQLTADAYGKLLEGDLFFSQCFANATGREGGLLSFAFQTVCSTARSGAIQAALRLVNNSDGLKLMELLYGAQDNLEKTVTVLATKPESVAAQNFAKKLRQLLDGDSVASISGLKDVIFTKKDLDGSVKAQQKINQEIGSRTQILPHGHLALVFKNGPPQGTVINAGSTYRYEYQLIFEAVGPGAAVEETFSVVASMKPAGWSAKLVNNVRGAVKLKTGDSTAIQVDVEIPAAPAVTESTLGLLVRSQSNPTEMTANNSEVTMKIGSGGVQPSAVNVELTQPVMNLETDTLSIGRGGPPGLPGKAANIRLRLSLLQASVAEDDYNLSFKPSANNLEPVATAAYKLGGQSGQQQITMITLSATAAANNSVGTSTDNLTVRIEKKNDMNVCKEIVIKYRVFKS